MSSISIIFYVFGMDNLAKKNTLAHIYRSFEGTFSSMCSRERIRGTKVFFGMFVPTKTQKKCL